MAKLSLIVEITLLKVKVTDSVLFLSKILQRIFSHQLRVLLARFYDNSSTSLNKQINSIILI